MTAIAAEDMVHAAAMAGAAEALFAPPELILGRDASDPAGSLGPVDVAWGYIGGNTPHVWTDRQWDAQQAPLGLPIWVYERGTDPILAAAGVLAWLVNHKVPHGCLVMIDMEADSDPAWVTRFADHVQAGGYRTLVYGSTSTLFTHPPRSGYVVADPDGVPQLYPHANVVGKQYRFDVTEPPYGTYDQSVMLSTLPLWRLPQHTTPPTPAWHRLLRAELDRINLAVQTITELLAAHGI